MRVTVSKRWVHCLTVRHADRQRFFREDWSDIEVECLGERHMFPLTP
jgi:hypothetical protein